MRGRYVAGCGRNAAGSMRSKADGSRLGRSVRSGNAAPHLVYNDRAVLLYEGANVSARQELEDPLRRPAAAHSERCFDDWPIDQDRIRHHKIYQLVVVPFSSRAQAPCKAYPFRAAGAAPIAPRLDKLDQVRTPETYSYRPKFEVSNDIIFGN